MGQLNEIRRESPEIWLHPKVLAPEVKERLDAVWQPGETVREGLARAGIDPHRLIDIVYNNRLLSVDEWDMVCPVTGDRINVRYALAGGGGGGGDSNAGKIIGQLVVAYIAYQTGVYVGGGWGAAASLAVSMAGSYAVNQMFPDKLPALSLSGIDGSMSGASPVYSLSGGSNGIRKYEPMQIVFGRHKVIPDYGMVPYTEYRGEDQYLYQIFHFGGSDLDKTELQAGLHIGDTPLSNYADIQLFWSDADGKIPQIPGNVDTAEGAELKASSGWVSRTGATKSTALAIDFTYVCYYANNAGGLDSRSINIEMQYRAVGQTAWQNFDTGSRSLSAATQTPQRLTIHVIVPEGQYEVRVRRTTADSTDSRETTASTWDYLRSYQVDEANYKGQLRLGMIAKASGQLNGAISQLWTVGSAKTWYWDGASWVYGATSNPAWWFLDVCRGRVNSDGAPLYGMHQSDSKIDIDGLKAWAIFCDAQGLTFNAVWDKPKSKFDTLAAIARCGLGSVTRSSGKLGVVWDHANASPTAAVGMSNIKKGSFRVGYRSRAQMDEVVVSYINADTWDQEQVRKTIPGTVGIPLKIETNDLLGCTSSTMAGKFANVLAATEYYRYRTITWEMDAEGMVLTRGDVVILSHDLTQWGYSGRLRQVSGDSVQLTAPVTRSAGGDKLIVIRPDGTMTEYLFAGSAGQTDTLAVSVTLQEGYSALDHKFIFGPATGAGKRVKVTSIKPGRSFKSFVLTGTDDDPEFYAAWGGTFTLINEKSQLVTAPEIGVQLAERRYLSAADAASPGAVISWDVTGGAVESVDMAWTLTKSDGTPITSGEQSTRMRSASLSLPSAGVLTVRVTPVNGSQRGTPKTASKTITAAFTPAAVAALNAVTATGGLYVIKLTWGYPVGYAADRVEIIYAASNSINAAVPLTTVSAPATSYTHPGLGIGQRGYYWLRMYDKYGNVSDWATATAVTDSDPAQLLEHLHGSISADQLTAGLREPIEAVPRLIDESVVARGNAEKTALAALGNALDAHDLQRRLSAQETITDAIVSVDPATGQIHLLATANVTTDVEARVTAAETKADATAGTLTGTVATMNQVRSDLTSAQSQIAQLANQITQTASEVYVDTAVENAAGSATRAMSQASNDLALAVLADAIDVFNGQKERRELSGSVAIAQQVLQAHSGALDAISQQTLTLAAAIGNAVSMIVAESQTRTTNEASTAIQITTLQSAVNNNASAIQIEAQTRTNALGDVLAKYGFKVQTLANGNRVVAGIETIAGQNGSEIVMLADKFMFCMPDGTGAKYAFTVGNVNGHSSVGINGDLIVDSSIAARSISTQSLSAISANIGEVTAGVAKNQAGTNFVNLNATGNEDFIKVGSNVSIKSNGSGYFSRAILSGPNVVYSNTFDNISLAPNQWARIYIEQVSTSSALLTAIGYPNYFYGYSDQLAAGGRFIMESRVVEAAGFGNHSANFTTDSDGALLLIGPPGLNRTTNGGIFVDVRFIPVAGYAANVTITNFHIDILRS